MSIGIVAALAFGSFVFGGHLFGGHLFGGHLFGSDVAAAQGLHHPFAVGSNEGAVGPQSGLGAWLIAQESRFYLALAGAVRATRTSSAGAVTLIALSFAYGIFHAAGPGHGKAVITLYMVSNERALRRGLVIAFLAAMLQASFAIALVGIAATLFHASSREMTAAAQTIEFFSYLFIFVLGLFLCWRKGWALVASFWPEPAYSSLAFAAQPAAVGHLARSAGTQSRFVADDGSGPHGADCDCIQMPDPRKLGARRFDFSVAAMTVVTAAAKPCSGAILVLVFALSQGVLGIGIASAYAMALGTAVTTGALACAAVYAKGLAQRLSGRTTRRAAILGRTVEFAAALCVLLVGGSLFFAMVGPMQPFGAARAQVINGQSTDDAAYAPRPPARWHSPESQGETPGGEGSGRDEPDVTPGHPPETPRRR